MVWTFFFLLWAALGAVSAYFILRGVHGHSYAARKYLAWTIAIWLSFSGIAAEITRQYLNIYPFPLVLCLAGMIGLVLAGIFTGGVAGWFIGGRGLGVAADAAAGALGCVLTGWMEVTLSYNHASYILPLSVLGGTFATMILRLCARDPMIFRRDI